MLLFLIIIIMYYYCTAAWSIWFEIEMYDERVAIFN